MALDTPREKINNKGGVLMPTYVTLVKFTPEGLKSIDDIRVRQALAMGIDNQAIKDEFYGGNAEMLCWPIMNI